ncbi:MAG TPA: fatty acid desaturase [bacterium]|jgi:omega-6 fatty acid desaturase (delta-12 desaturase)
MHREDSRLGAVDTTTAVKPVQSTAASVWQVVNTIPPFCGLLFLMYRLLPVSYLLVLALAVLAAGFMVRTFIIQHDCGHGSFFKSRKANDRMGWFCSLFTLIPYHYWKREHALHHATSGNLDRRGYGDMDIFTVGEYMQLSRWKRFRYRAYRHPLVFLLVGPPVAVLLQHRMASDKKQTTKRQRRNVYTTNLTMVSTVLILGWLMGFVNLLLIAVPVLYLALGAGIWLFYIQHQFEHTYWKRGAEWNSIHAAMQGSSFYKLPKVLQWFTGNIGFHHIHHLDEHMPNYRLPQIYEQHPELQDVFTVTIRSSLKTAFLSVWDERQERLISFRELKRRYSGEPAEDAVSSAG